MTDFEKFNELVRYDPETGKLFWRGAKMGRQFGKAAGHKDKAGYIRLMIDYKMYLAHRIIWLLAYGHWPEQHIDHIDGNPANNRLENLRDVSRSVNMRNSKAKSDNFIGVRGISLNRLGTFDVRLQGNWVGTFEKLEDAITAKDRYNGTH